MAPDAADLTAAIREAFPDAVGTGFEDLIQATTVDPDDRHVAAAAIVGHAQVIVTPNTKHFPQRSLATHHVDVQSPDAFLTHLFTLDPEAMARLSATKPLTFSLHPWPLRRSAMRSATAPGLVALVRPLIS